MSEAIWSFMQTSLSKELVKELELSLLRQQGSPKYANMLLLRVVMTVEAVMSTVGSSQMNLVKLSLTERMYLNPFDDGLNFPKKSR